MVRTITGGKPLLAFIRTINRWVGSPLVCTTDPGAFSTSTRIVTAQEQWEFTLTGFGAGRYNIQLTASDGTNVGTAGNADATAAGALTFEIDKGLPAPTGTDPLPDVPATTAMSRKNPI